MKANLENELIEEICRSIALREPFPYDEILAFFTEKRSFDELFDTIELAKELNEKSLFHVPYNTIRDVLPQNIYKGEQRPDQKSSKLDFKIQFKVSN